MERVQGMKSHTFEVNGIPTEFYAVLDVKEFFLRPLYRSDVLQAIKSIKQEMKMRAHVFRDDKIKRDLKMKEMELVLQILTRCLDDYPELQREMFE